MHSLDIIASVILCVFLFFGMKDGLIEGIFQLLAAIGGFAGAILWYPMVYDKLDFIKISAHNLTVISFVICFFILLCAILLIGWTIKKLIHLTPLGWIDRLLGGILGMLKAAILIWIFVLSVIFLPQSKLKSSFTGSYTYKILKDIPIRLSLPKFAEIKKIESTIKEKKEQLDNLKKKMLPADAKKHIDMDSI